MVPPLAIALASTFFKNKFTEEERKSGLTNYVLGLSFITEGAIPFAAADPLRVLTSCILGSAVAGGLTQLWNINVPSSAWRDLCSCPFKPRAVVPLSCSDRFGHLRIDARIMEETA